MLLELMLIVYLLVGGAAFLESRCKESANENRAKLAYALSSAAFLLNCVAKVRQFSDTTKFHPAELC